ncbi:phosphatase PAP2 family protein [Mucilaginibacter terrae]|uniref:Membrane-associated phospholipid phosphatase n=1 Tax=Mucilaginibacter terrae TaxID=1955052 RepID=A0ABU3GY37_9SPHI|nr:phosphatase PAP2 family protein [Mucilaginibacter terrae]MDT3404682.1 membrane-associated phospholipid phosphatase [Mucilaginibacter terrae]
MNKQPLLIYIITTIFVTALGISAHAQLSQPTILRQIDTDIMVNFAENRTPARTDFYYFMSKTNLYGNALVPASLLIGGTISGNKEMRQNAAYIASSSVLSYGAVLLIKKLLKRPRPFRGNYRIMPVYIAGDYSFPSGHSSSAFSTATSLSMAYPKWYVIAPSALWAGSVAYSRMYLGLHYPSDVAVGSLMGAGTAVYLNTIRNRVQ